MPELRIHYTHDRRTLRRAGADPARHGRLRRRACCRRLSPASCSAPVSRSMRRSTSSSCPTPSARARSSQAFRRPAHEVSRATTTTTWSLAQYRLVTEGLGLRHLRLVLGNSMGGMHTWIWGVKYPDFMDALVPMASQPTEMSSRNWMMRRLHHRFDPQRSGLERRQLHRAAALAPGRQRVLRHRHQRRHAGLPEGWRRHARRPTSCSTSAWPRRSAPMPTTSCTSGNPRATTTRRRARAHPGRAPGHQLRPTTSATRPRPASWSASSSA